MDSGCEWRFAQPALQGSTNNHNNNNDNNKMREETTRTCMLWICYKRAKAHLVGSIEVSAGLHQPLQDGGKVRRAGFMQRSVAHLSVHWIYKCGWEDIPLTKQPELYHHTGIQGIQVYRDGIHGTYGIWYGIWYTGIPMVEAICL
jgi:hypothetical protein